MIRNTLHKPLLLLATVLALSLVTWGACSNANVKGSYGYTVNGVDKNGTPITNVGHFKADGKGKFTGVQTTSDGGSIFSNVPSTGTYSINSDCTGSGTITLNGSQTDFALVVVSGGNTLQILNTDSPNIQSGSAQAQGKATCTNAGVKGSFGIEATGAFVGLGPVALTGLFTLDGAGKLSGTESGSIAGQIFTGAPVTGTYKIKSNCTGSGTFKITGEPAQHANLVVINAGKGLLVIETDTNTVVSGSGQQ